MSGTGWGPDRRVIAGSGDAGEVIVVDPSVDMRNAAASQCEAAQRAHSRRHGSRLPLDDGTADRAASLQVFEYLGDIPGALLEIRPVLRPGARLVIGDMHWDSWIWHSYEPERMARDDEGMGSPSADRCVPAKLPHLMREAGYEIETITPLVFSRHRFSQGRLGDDAAEPYADLCHPERSCR